MYDKYPIFQIPKFEICEGVIRSEIGNEKSPIRQYNVKLTKTPIGKINTPISAIPLFSPGSDGKYRINDRVIVLTQFVFNTDENESVDIVQGSGVYILGKYDGYTELKKEFSFPGLPSEKGSTRFINPNSKIGMAAHDNGSVVISAMGPVSEVYKSGGNGSYENSNTKRAQNFIRILSKDPDFYFSREHFGVYHGKDEMEKAVNATPIQNSIVYRRFVAKSKLGMNWVSTCEGTYSPYYGPNNMDDVVNKTKDVLYTKIVNSELIRSTLEIGENGKHFFNYRVDMLILNEHSLPLKGYVTPAILGNKFKANIGVDGSLVITASNMGIPGANMAGVKISTDILGNLTVQSKGSVTIKHGDADVLQSITSDPIKGVEINSAVGVKVNGQPVVTEAFLNWFAQFLPMMYISSMPGTPAVVNPGAIATFNTFKNFMYPMPNAFTTKGVGIPNIGIIMDPDTFSSV